MSKELPYFKFFPTEWLLGRINNENATIQISFLKSCCLYWQKDCKLNVNELSVYVPLVKIKYLIEEDYIQCRYIDEFTKKNKIKIKFLDEQKLELSEKRNKKVEAGRLGGKQSALNRKKKTKKDYINELTTHPDPNMRIHKDTAKLLIEDKIKRGEILI